MELMELNDKVKANSAIGFHRLCSNQGFTIIEIMIALVISGIVIASMYTAFQSQQDNYVVQDRVAELQQSLRASMYLLTRELRMAGFDPKKEQIFSITNVRSVDLNNNADPAGNHAISFIADLDKDGIVDPNETVSYSLYEYPVAPVADRDGIVDLARNNGGGRQLVAENIVALGLAYSYDDGTGLIQTDQASIDINGDGNVDVNDQVVVWAVDSDNDGDLDINIDSDKNGRIDINDNVAGTALPGGVDIETKDIRAVKIWLLARTKARDKDFLETRTFVVANKRINPSTDGDPSNDGCRYRLLETIVKCRNMGL